MKVNRQSGDDLNLKQRRFCEEYIHDLNATQAAIRAGYSPKTAETQGSRLLTYGKVQNYIQKLQAARSLRTEVSADAVIEELRRIAFYDPGDYANVVKKKNDDDKEFDDVEIADTKEMSREKRSAIESIKVNRFGCIEVKLQDKLRALELLGRHLGMFKDKMEIDAAEGTGVVLIPDVKSPEVKEDE